MPEATAAALAATAGSTPATRASSTTASSTSTGAPRTCSCCAGATTRRRTSSTRSTACRACAPAAARRSASSPRAARARSSSCSSSALRGDAGDDRALAERVRRRVLERTGLAPAQVHVLAAGTLPRTSSGKIRRAETCRALPGRRAHGTPQRVTALRLVREMLRSRLAFAPDGACRLISWSWAPGRSGSRPRSRRGCAASARWCSRRRRPPLDKACGEGLMPAGVAALARMGVRLPDGASMPFAGIRYVDGDVVAEGRFAEGEGRGVRRTVLSQALLERADGARRRDPLRDARCAPGRGARPACARRRRSGPSTPGSWSAPTGCAAAIRREAGLEARPPRGRARHGLRRHFGVAPWSDLVEVHWADGVEAYVTPVAPDEVGVALLWRGGSARYGDLLARFPALAARLAGAPLRSSVRGAGALRAARGAPLRAGGRAGGRRGGLPRRDQRRRADPRLPLRGGAGGGARRGPAPRGLRARLPRAERHDLAHDAAAPARRRAPAAPPPRDPHPGGAARPLRPLPRDHRRPGARCAPSASAARCISPAASSPDQGAASRPSASRVTSTKRSTRSTKVL